MRFILMLLLSLTTAAALDQGGAEAAVARGYDALAASDSDRSKSVDAALAFTEALGFYRLAGDNDTCRELQANIYWARKRMSQEHLTAYVNAKIDDTAAMAVAEEMERIVTQEVAPAEADAYFARAEAYAKANPTQHLKIAIRYFEVASRFTGTQAAMDAQQRSLDAQAQATTGKVAATKKPAKDEADKPSKDEKKQAQKLAATAIKAANAGMIPVSWIESVKYGAANSDSSVKTEFLAFVGREDELRIGNSLFNIDPAPNRAKALTITWKTPSGQKKSKVLRETETFTPAKLLFDDRAGAAPVAINESVAPKRRR